MTDSKRTETKYHSVTLCHVCEGLPFPLPGSFVFTGTPDEVRCIEQEYTTADQITVQMFDKWIERYKSNPDQVDILERAKSELVEHERLFQQSTSTI